MNVTDAIGMMRQVVRRQHKALAMAELCAQHPKPSFSELSIAAVPPWSRAAAAFFQPSDL
jgi:hypothetical protein